MVDTSGVRGFAARARVVAGASGDYPRRLRDLRDAPEVVRVVGELPDLSRAVAIVGTRRADDEALDFAYSLGREVAMRGVIVVSGGAIGIDRAAHEGALDGGGRTVVVLPTGLDAPYPKTNHDLFARAVEAGCLLSEVEDGADARRGRFIKRNRIIAALGCSTIVVQAPLRSGALSTAAVARRLGRPVFTVPASPWDPRGSGNLKLIRGGARICVGPGDVLSETPRGGGQQVGRLPKANEKPIDFSDLTQVEQTILDSLGARARHADDLCRRTGIPAFEVQRSILNLLVRGLIEEKPGGRVQRCRGGGKPY